MSYYYYFWENREKILDKRTLLVRFEDIILEPVSTMKKIADHVDVEYTDNLIRPTLRGTPSTGGSSFHQLKGIDKSTVSREIKSLTEKEMDFLDVHLKEIMDFFDYKKPVHI